MAKKSMIERERKRSKLILRYRDKRNAIRSNLKLATSISDIFYMQEKLQKLPRNSLPIRLRNRCWKTGRGRGFYRDFGLSRHVLREMAHSCLLPGVTKSSW